MIHTEPETTMSVIISVKPKATTFQRCSIEPSRCRKYSTCTMTWITAIVRIAGEDGAVREAREHHHRERDGREDDGQHEADHVALDGLSVPAGDADVAGRLAAPEGAGARIDRRGVELLIEL